MYLRGSVVSGSEDKICEFGINLDFSSSLNFVSKCSIKYSKCVHENEYEIYVYTDLQLTVLVFFVVMMPLETALHLTKSAQPFLRLFKTLTRHFYVWRRYTRASQTKCPGKKSLCPGRCPAKIKQRQKVPM